MNKNSIFKKETCVGGVATSRDSSDFGRDEHGRIRISLSFFPNHTTNGEVNDQQNSNPPHNLPQNN